ncbi:ornithine cyclodeaminase family protein [Psychrobacillus glaciei]|uniref:Ornithine cyclodeaminase family protein n=1 Tax=Psychrobacillus glaciei TaxID=2283160 RepID=A0A5J6SI64_9BACI|nr:ornithine cyclodeaminase family protein [Psychrobacillus glaciei]QFF97630.1 ornithine cyclodeaminase family protein [Psychrobacillus glaciei]
MLFINQDEVSTLLSMKSCMKVMESTLIDLAQGKATQVLRSVLAIDDENVLGQMPGYLKKNGVLGTKVITVFPNNHKHGLPSHQGVVLLFNAKNGELMAVVDGSEITAIRTAAVSALATDKLSRVNSKILCLLGTGTQAKTHLEAMLTVRPIELVKIWSRNIRNANQFKEEMQQKFKVSIILCDTAEEAALDADIICTVTSSTEPILKATWVKAGAHVNAVGACKPNDRELDSELVRTSKLYVDSIESTQNESGDYLIPLKEGVIEQNHIIGEIGRLLIYKNTSRTSETDITIFKSLGLAIEDIAAANFIYEEIVRKFND